MPAEEPEAEPEAAEPIVPLAALEAEPEAPPPIAEPERDTQLVGPGIELQPGQRHHGDEDDRGAVKWHRQVLAEEELSGAEEQAERDHQAGVADLEAFDQLEGQHHGEQADRRPASG